MSVSDGEAHHPLSTEIVTVLSHLVTGECWGMKGKAEAVRKMWHEKRWWIKCGVTGCHIKVVAVKNMKMMKRSMKVNWRRK